MYDQSFMFLTTEQYQWLTRHEAGAPAHPRLRSSLEVLRDVARRSRDHLDRAA